jgi:glycosyltransferase involved in cell wall biosynthesis
MILLSHPTGNANVRAVMRALEQAGVLDSFYTSLGVGESGRIRWQNFFHKKRQYSIPQSKLNCRPLRETVRLMSQQLRLKSPGRHEVGWASIDSVYCDLDRTVSRHLSKTKGEICGVYAYEDGALETFRTARKLNIRRYYDLPIAYWETAQRLLGEEVERWPAWEPTLGGTRDSAAKLARKTEEMELAEVVICPSAFVATSLPPNARTKKTIIAHFGSPIVSSEQARSHDPAGKLRVLFAGSMSQRKGLADLMSAMRIMNRKDVELVVMGSPQAPMEFYRKEFPAFVYEPTRPHVQVLELMRSCDVLCLPSIVEGRALVMQESMSQGLPLIITKNTGGEDLIDEGLTGFLIPIRDPGKIAEKIAWFADHRSAIPDMSRAARLKANQLTWEVYGQMITKTILA